MSRPLGGMPVLTFRLKLALGMMLLVAGGALATLLIAQHQVQAYYERNFRAQFARQVAFSLALQDSRLANVKDQCLKLSQKVRIVAAMSEAEIPAEILYDVTDDELKALIGDLAQDAAQDEPATAGRVNATFFRFLDAHGRPVQPPETGHERLGLASSQKLLEQRLALLRGALQSRERQQVGYLALPRNPSPGSHIDSSRSIRPSLESIERSGALALQEVVITKILDPETDLPLGALVLGFPVAETVIQGDPAAPFGQTGQLDPMQTGILLDDRLYIGTNAVPASIAAIAARNIGQRIHDNGRTQDDFNCKLRNSYYRLFYQLLNRESCFPPAYQVCLYAMDEARRELAQLRWRILGSGCAALLGALALSLLLSHGLSVPVRELAAGTLEIRRGNFAVKVPVRSRDEIGQLAVSFNEMADGLAQKERYRTVLNQVADEQVARQLISGQITLGGELRQASVLFCDIRGFTALTEKMPPVEVINLLNEHMTALTRVVKEHHGVLDKFVGDLLMVIFGAPASHGDDVLDAARCALGLLHQREFLNRTSRRQIQVGIGLATGNVVAGGMGSAERFHYTVLGERVNLASRLCSLAGPGEVLIDQTTCESLGNHAVLKRRPPAPIKGFSSPVEVYELCSMVSLPSIG